MNKGKFRFAKCPYCGKEYEEGPFEYALMNLATKGYVKEEKVRCHDCGEYFKITVKIMYYGCKIK